MKTHTTSGLLAIAFSFVLAGAASAYEVSIGTIVANADSTVVVPVALDSAAGLSYAGASIAYDPQVLVVLDTEPGSLVSAMAEDFVAADTNGVVTVTIFGSPDKDVDAASGTIARITFAVRAGTEGLYSDLAISSVDLGEHTGVKDVTVGNPVATVSGMVRVMASSAAVERLESPQTIAPDTSLGSLALSAGDALQASDLQTPIAVSGAVSAPGDILVRAPVNGWASGTYTLLTTATAGLTFALENAPAGTAVSASTADGITTYTATVAVEGEIPVVCESDDLPAGAKNQIRSLLAGSLDGANRIVVTGPEGRIALLADMGIAPSCSVDGAGVAHAAYGMPNLRITSFDPETGAVRIKVTPAEGNRIASEIAVGYIHVYGTDALGTPMRYIERVGFDLTPYLKPATLGEAVLNVTLGTHTFLKVKVEDVDKFDGEQE